MRVRGIVVRKAEENANKLKKRCRFSNNEFNFQIVQ